MAFIESPRFPDRLAYGAEGGPGFSTGIVTLASGREARNANMAYPRHSWDVSQGIKNQADFALLRAFFLAARGRFSGWRFKDWADYQAQHTGDERGAFLGLTATTFQMVKRYTSGALTQDRIIRKPVSATIAVKDGATDLALGTDYTLDGTTGIITTATTRAALTLTWAGEFDVPMRFDTDELRGRIVARNAQGLLHEWAEIPIVEDMSA